MVHALVVTSFPKVVNKTCHEGRLHLKSSVLTDHKQFTRNLVNVRMTDDSAATHNLPNCHGNGSVSIFLRCVHAAAMKDSLFHLITADIVGLRDSYRRNAVTETG